MTMELQQRIKAFVSLGESLNNILENINPDSWSQASRALAKEIKESRYSNPWFTTENVENALKGITRMLKEEEILRWIEDCPFKPGENQTPKTIGVVMAGNLPVVGFHDMLCVVISGHKFLGKLSSQDQNLPVKLAHLLCEGNPGLSSYIEFTREKLVNFDAIIATGSNNTSRYFEYYFGKYPHIIRKNRNSVAVLSGLETQQQMQGLCRDIFYYFGMGCRSVSALLVPDNWDPNSLLNNMDSWEYLRDHHKYFNNYEYQKAIMLVNQESHYDTGFLLLRQQTSLTSPLAVLNYFTYNRPMQIPQILQAEKENIQCVASSLPLNLDGIQVVQLGQTQFPGLSDYADGVDTLKFLLDL